MKPSTRTKRALRLAGGVAFALLAALPIQASSYSLGLDFTGNTSTTYFGGPGVVGWSFNLASPLELYGIGFFDAATMSSLGTPVLVGLWDSGGNLLLSGFITNTTSDVVVPSIDCCGEWLFDTPGIPIETLPAGNYVIGALIPASSQIVIASATTAPTFPGITFGENLQGSGAGGLVEPSLSESQFGLGFFGPNILVGPDPNAVPEPGTVSLIAGSLLVLVRAVRRKRD